MGLLSTNHNPASSKACQSGRLLTWSTYQRVRRSKGREIGQDCSA